MDTPYAFVARIEAKPEKAEAPRRAADGRLGARAGRAGTVDWYAARTSPTTFWIFDTFGSEDARQAHVNGEIPKALMAHADELLAWSAGDPPRRRAGRQVTAGVTSRRRRR